jgi:hypothetical protein
MGLLGVLRCLKRKTSAAVSNRRHALPVDMTTPRCLPSMPWLQLMERSGLLVAVLDHEGRILFASQSLWQTRRTSAFRPAPGSLAMTGRRNCSWNCPEMAPIVHAWFAGGHASFVRGRPPWRSWASTSPAYREQQTVDAQGCAKWLICREQRLAGTEFC